MTDEEAAAFLRLALTSEEARGYLKKRTEGGKANNPFGTKGRTYTPLRVRALCRGACRHREKAACFLSDRHWRLYRNKGLHPCAAYAAILHTHKNSIPAFGVCTIFAGFHFIREVIPIAIYHCNISIVSRGKGKSAVAAAAYRSGEKADK